MFQNFEALAALEEFGTMSRAAARLGVTQPAISKRIQQFEHELGRKLVEPSGRRVVLTPYAESILQRAKPLYLEFKEALQEEISEGTGELIIALSGALLLSWGAKVLRSYVRRIQRLHSHLQFIARRLLSRGFVLANVCSLLSMD